MKTTQQALVVLIAAIVAPLVFVGCSSGVGGGEPTGTPGGNAAYTEVIAPQYEDALDFSEGLAAVKKDGKWGFIDKTGAEVIPFIYDVVQPFSDGLALARLERDGLIGFIDKSGKEVIPFKYEGALPFAEGFAVVQLPGIAGLDPAILFIDKSGNEVTPLYYSAESFSEGLAVVQHGMSNYIYIDTSGKEVISIGNLNRGTSFSEGLAMIYHFENQGFIDKTGKTVFALDDYKTIGSVEPFSEGLACVETSAFNHGFIDQTGVLVIAIDGTAKSFSEGLAAVSSYSDWGYIDKTGAEVIPYKYEAANSFHEGFAAVELDGKLGFINKAGEEVVPFLYDTFDFDSISEEDLDIENLTEEDLSRLSVVRDYVVSEGMAAVRLDGKWGYISLS